MWSSDHSSLTQHPVHRAPEVGDKRCGVTVVVGSGRPQPVTVILRFAAFLRRHGMSSHSFARTLMDETGYCAGGRWRGLFQESVVEDQAFAVRAVQRQAFAVRAVQ